MLLVQQLTFSFLHALNLFANVQHPIPTAFLQTIDLIGARVLLILLLFREAQHLQALFIVYFLPSILSANAPFLLIESATFKAPRSKSYPRTNSVVRMHFKVHLIRTDPDDSLDWLR